MYRFPDPLDEAALKGLIADKRFQDPRHPEHGFFKKFVAKAFELVHPDAPRDAAGRAVLDPREPPTPQVVQGGEVFKPDETSSAELGTFQLIASGTDRTAKADIAPHQSNVPPYRRDVVIGPVTQTPLLREADRHGAGYFGAPRGNTDHKGSDMRAKKGDAIRSPVDGIIVVPRFDPYGNKQDGRERKLSAIQIEDDEGRAVRLLYVDGSRNLKPGMRIKKGEVIGAAQDVSAVYKSIGKPGMNNHVHVEVWQPKDPTRRAQGYLSRDTLYEFYTPRNAWRLIEMEGRD